MNMKHIFLCSMTNYKKWKVDAKIYTLFVLILVFSIWNFSGVYEYARIVGYGVSPWIFPHLLVAPIMMPIYGCFAMLLFSDAPFIDKHTPFRLVEQAGLLGYWGNYYIFF